MKELIVKIKSIDFKTNFKRNIHLLILISLFIIVVSVLHQPWYIYLLSVLLYLIANYLIFLGDSIGLTGYFVQTIGKEELAIKCYQSAEKLGGKNQYALISYGLILLKDFQAKEALIRFEKLDSLKNKKPILEKYNRHNLGICYWKIGDLKKSIEIFDKMIEDYEVQSINFLTTLGFIYLLNGNEDKAFEFTNKALEEDPDHGPAYDNLGQIYYRQNKLDLAEENFLKALELKNTMVDSKYYLGLIYEEKDDIEKAKFYFEEAFNCNINGLNTVTPEQVEEKHNKYK